MREHAAVRQVAADLDMQLVGFEEALALAELETALPVRVVVRYADELQRTDGVEGDNVRRVLGHDPVQIPGLEGNFEFVVQLTNAGFVRVDGVWHGGFSCHVGFA